MVALRGGGGEIVGCRPPGKSFKQFSLYEGPFCYIFSLWEPFVLCFFPYGGVFSPYGVLFYHVGAFFCL